MLNVTSDFKLVLSAIFSSAWKIATSFQVPGTNMTIPEFVFSCIMVVFVIRMVPYLLGMIPIFGASDEGDSNRGVSRNYMGNKGGNHKGTGRW